MKALRLLGRSSIVLVNLFGLLVFPSNYFGGVLGDLANQMQPGTFQKITTTGFNLFLFQDQLGGGGSGIASFTDKGSWDNTGKKLFFLGADNGFSGGLPRGKFISYDETTNAWSTLPRPVPPWTNIDHGYNHRVINQGTRTIYGRYYNNKQIYKYNIATATWTTIPTKFPETDGSVAAALGWFPERNELIFVDGGFSRIQRYSETSQSWISSIGGLTGMGNYSTFAEYSPVHKVIIFGGGGGTSRVFRYNEDGTVTSMPNAPVSLGMHATVVSLDPVTGHFLVGHGNGTFWQYNPTGTGTWTQLPNHPLAQTCSGPVGTASSIYGTFAAPIAAHGVTLYVKAPTCGSFSQAAVYLYKHSGQPAPPPPPPPSDSTAPIISLITSAPATFESTVTWTTNEPSSSQVEYGVTTGYGSATTLDQALVTNHSQRLVGLAFSTTYHYRVKSTDASGNLTVSLDEVLSSVIAANPPPVVIPPPIVTPPPATTADADFQKRCTAPGVVKCVGFNNTTSDIVHNVNSFPSTAGTRPTLDTTVKTSGAGALKMVLPAAEGANAGGYWVDSLGANFKPGSNWYVQFRYRMSPEMLIPSVGGGGNKMVILHSKEGGSCANAEITTNNGYWRGYPQMYTQCGDLSPTDNLGNGDFLLQNGKEDPRFECHYQKPTERSPYPCGYFRTNEWTTFAYHISLGNWGTASSTIRGYYGYAGQPLRQFIYKTNYVINQGSAINGFNRILLSGYDTGRSSHPKTATIWYDELIVSTQPIAAPGI